MGTFINKEDFSSLANGDKLYGHGSTFEIEVANCGEQCKYPTHLISTEINGRKEHNYIFHDGQDIRYSSTEDSGSNGAIVGELIDDGTCRIIQKSKPVRNRMRRNNLSLIGTGNYCPECVGLCGNSNHTSRKW